MMNTMIYKYPLEITDFQTISLPKGAELLTVQVQRNTPCLWARVDASAELEQRSFETFGTGHTIYEEMGVDRRYIATYQVSGGSLVFHVFERIK